MNKSSKKEGEVTIDYLPESDKKVQKDKGKYVDYEEVPDKQSKNTDQDAEQELTNYYFRIKDRNE